MLPWVVHELGGRKPSLKLRVSMFNDKPPCLPLCFGVVDYIASSFFLFLSLCDNNGAFSSAFSSCFSFSSSSRSFSSIFLLSLTQFLADVSYVTVLGSVFSPDGLCNCLRLDFQPGRVM